MKSFFLLFFENVIHTVYLDHICLSTPSGLLSDPLSPNFMSLKNINSSPHTHGCWVGPQQNQNQNQPTRGHTLKTKQKATLSPKPLSKIPPSVEPCPPHSTETLTFSDQSKSRESTCTRQPVQKAYHSVTWASDTSASL